MSYHTIAGSSQIPDTHLRVCMEGRVRSTEPKGIYFQHLTRVLDNRYSQSIWNLAKPGRCAANLYRYETHGAGSPLKFSAVWLIGRM